MAADRRYDFVWFWRSRLPERKGEPCRILVRSRRLNSCLAEFADGLRSSPAETRCESAGLTSLLPSQVDLLPQPGEEVLHCRIVDQVQHQEHRTHGHHEGYEGSHSSHLTGTDIVQIPERDD